VRGRVGVGDVARHLSWVIGGGAEVAEHRSRVVTGLLGHDGKIDAARIDAWGRTGLQTTDTEIERPQPVREGLRRGIPGTAATRFDVANVDQPREESAGREHHLMCLKAQAILRAYARHPVADDLEVVDRRLEHREVRLPVNHRADRIAVEAAVCLCAGGAHGRALARVQGAKLNARKIGSVRHGATECINLLDEVALADAANRRIATHLPNGFDIVG